jgi:hypothetical protein
VIWQNLTLSRHLSDCSPFIIQSPVNKALKKSQYLGIETMKLRNKSKMKTMAWVRNSASYKRLSVRIYIHALRKKKLSIGLAVLSGSKLSLKVISNSILIYILLNKLLYNHWNQSEKMGVLWDEYSSSSKDEIGFIVLQWWWEKEQRWDPLCEEIV